MHHRNRILAAAGAAILLAGSGAALAQAPPPGGAPLSQDQLRQRFEARHAERAKALHDALQLRADQEGAWREYQAALAPPADKMTRRFDPAARAQMTTPQRLDAMAQRMAERQARFQKMADATKRFYAVLSPQQQKAFDATAHRGGGRGKGGHGFGHGGHRGGPAGGR